MLLRTNEKTSTGRRIYTDCDGKNKKTLPIGKQTSGRRIPEWCFRYISPIGRQLGHYYDRVPV